MVLISICNAHLKDVNIPQIKYAIKESPDADKIDELVFVTWHNHMQTHGGRSRGRTGVVAVPIQHVVLAATGPNRDMGILLIPPRIPVSKKEIEHVVTVFYARVRKDPTIGPIFNTSIGTNPVVWAEHEAKIVSFWNNAIHYEKGYSGNPMMVHSGISDIRSQHFQIWLSLFEETVQEELAPDVAASFHALASRIGYGLRMGVEQAQMQQGGIPHLG